jgi:hypothetical protein
MILQSMPVLPGFPIQVYCFFFPPLSHYCVTQLPPFVGCFSPVYRGENTLRNYSLSPVRVEYL